MVRPAAGASRSPSVASPRSRSTPGRCPSASAPPTARSREAVMVETEPGAVPLRVPAVAGLLDLRADRRRRLARSAGRSSASTGRRWPRRGSGSASPGAAYSGFRSVDDPRQHLVFLPDTEVELTLVGTEPLVRRPPEGPPGQHAPSSSASTTGRSPRTGPSARRRRWRSCSPRKQTGLDSKPAFLSLGLLKDREPRVTLRAVGRRRPCHAGRHDPALRRRDRRPRPGGPPPPARPDARSSATKDKPETEDAARDGRRSRCPPTRPAVLDHQARHDVPSRPTRPPSGTVLRFVAEADDRCARGVQTGRSSVAPVPGRLAGRAVLRDPDPPAGRAGQVPGGARGRREADAGPGRQAVGRRLLPRHARPCTPARGSSTRSPAGSPTRSRR